MLACLLVLLALLAPDEFGRLTPGCICQHPAGGTSLRRSAALPAGEGDVGGSDVFGVALGLLGIMKLLDMGFFAVLARPFDPLLDWKLLDDAMRFLAGSIGPVPAIGSLAVAVASAPRWSSS